MSFSRMQLVSPFAVAIFITTAVCCPSSYALTCPPHQGGYDLSGEKIRFYYRWYRPSTDDIDRIVEAADKSSFTVIHHPFLNIGSCGQLVFNYGRDSKHVYFQGRIIDGADPDTFSFFHRSYAKDKRSVYGPSRRISGRLEEFRVLVGSYATDGLNHFYEDEIIDDPDFEILVGGYGYARSSTRVFRYGKVLDGVDASSFEHMFPASRITRDKNHVYYEDKPIIGADPKTFEQLPPPYLFRDWRAVYLEKKELDPTSYRFSKYGTYTIYGLYVYRGMKKLHRDIGTFEELEPPWSRDRFNVYHDDIKIHDADPASFRAISASSGEDKNYRYEREQIVCKIDPKAQNKYPDC